MDDPSKIYRVLIKFMDESFVESLLKKGLLYMNNIDYFKNYEDSDIALRGDIHEGLAASYKADDLVIHFGGQKIEGAVGKVDLRYNHEGANGIAMLKPADTAEFFRLFAF